LPVSQLAEQRPAATDVHWPGQRVSQPQPPQWIIGQVTQFLLPDGRHRKLGYHLSGNSILASLDGGRNWTAALTPGDHTLSKRAGCHPARYKLVAGVAATPMLPGAIFVATTGQAATAANRAACYTATGGLFILLMDSHGGIRRTDSLAAGLPFAAGAQQQAPRAFALLEVIPDPVHAEILYARAALPPAAGSTHVRRVGLYRSVNGGRYWSPAMAGLPRGSSGIPAGRFYFDTADTDILLELIAGKLYRSVNRGGYWSLPRGLRTAQVADAYVNPTNPQLMYALTDRGLFHSLDAGASWSPMVDSSRQIAPRIRALRFDLHDPAALTVLFRNRSPLTLHESAVPPTPRFEDTVALSPLQDNQVILAFHSAPSTSARLTVVHGADRVAADLMTDGSGVGYALVTLTGSVSLSHLLVRIETAARRLTVQPWILPGWSPVSRPAPHAAATPSATATATMTPTATATATPTPPQVPTPYPASSLQDFWHWQPLVSTLPVCAQPAVPVTSSVPLSGSLAGSPSPTAQAVGSGGTATVAPPASPQPTLQGISGLAPADVISTTPGLSTTATSTMAPQATGTTSPTPTDTAGAAATGSAQPSDTALPPTDTPTPVGPCTAPPKPRQDFATSWDNSSHQLFVFGGTDSKTAASYNDLSAYSTITNAWTLLQPDGQVPPPRYGAGAVWDTTLNIMLVFGGMTGAGRWARFYNDLWAYLPASNAWLLLSANGAPDAPSPRAHAAVAWDLANNRLLLFAGQTNDSYTPGLTNDLWAYTFTGAAGSWSNLSPNDPSRNLPPPRQWASIAWDQPAGVLRMFGGKNVGSGAMSDTWAWSPLSGWQFDPVPDQPPGLQAAGYAWDDTHQRFVVGAGLTMFGTTTDLWQYDGQAHDWLHVPIIGSSLPPPRQMGRLAWDSAEGEGLLFGGRLSGQGVSNDLWALIPTGSPAPAVTPVPSAGKVAKAVDIGQTVSNVNDSLLLTPAMVRRIVASGATYARVSFDIGAGQQQWTPSRLHSYEQVVGMLNQQGIGVIGVASHGITVSWPVGSWTQNANETTGGDGENPAIEDFVHQFAMLVAHFAAAPYLVHRWEVWNEPNVPLAGCTATATSVCLQQPGLQPSNFAALLAQAYDAVKGNPATSGVQLISGGLYSYSSSGAYNATSAGAAYLKATYDAGLNRTALWQSIKAKYGSYPLDLIGLHLYVDQSQRTTPAVLKAYLGWLHDAYGAYEAGGKGIALTEVGWRTGDTNQPKVTQDIQALNLDAVFGAVRQLGYVSDVCWFQLQDNPGFVNNTSWGLLDRNAGQKPAFQHFQAQ
jgi:hypothetical protein